MQSERAKFKTLLSYMLDHNKKHVEELEELAVKAQELGETRIHDDVLQLIEQMNKANKTLEEDLRIIKA